MILYENERARELVDRYADTILRLSYTYLKNTHDAQDICQDVLVKLLADKGKFGKFAYYCWIVGAVALVAALVIR